MMIGGKQQNMEEVDWARRWGPSHMQESIFINQKMTNNCKRDQEKEKT